MRALGTLATCSFLAGVSFCAIIHVPTGQPTIQAGINAAVDGDTVLVAPGTYKGTGNRDIDFDGTNLLLLSVNGALETIIDCQGDSLNPHRGFHLYSGEDSSCIIDGFTIMNGYLRRYPVAHEGAGLRCGLDYSSNSDEATPTVRNCIFKKNRSEYGGAISTRHAIVLDNVVFDSNTSFSENPLQSRGYGGAMNLGNSSHRSDVLIKNCTFRGNTSGRGGAIYVGDRSPVIMEDCVFSDNSAYSEGGAIYFYGGWSLATHCLFISDSAGTGGSIYFGEEASPTVENCTFVGDHATIGGSMNVGFSNPKLTRNIVAFSESGGGISCGVGLPYISGTNIFGNRGGDWTECIDSQKNLNDNLCIDPIFCDTAVDNYYLSSSSPCAPANNPMGMLIGALPVGCYTGVANEVARIPIMSKLMQNYPNPFNPATTIEYNIAKRSHVIIDIFNVLGQRIRKLIDETKSAGSYRIEWDGIDDTHVPVSTGIYLYRFHAGDVVQTKKMLLIR